MQFGPKPLFENISVKFGEGNRYGLIGANGCGKSTFMKILGGDLEPSAGNVALEPNVRLGKLRQDQFAYEDVRVLDVVMMGHTEMWAAMTERDAIYANPEATDDDYMHAAELEVLGLDASDPVLDAFPALRRPAEHALDLRADVGEALGVPVDRPRDRLGRFDQGAVDVGVRRGAAFGGHGGGRCGNAGIISWHAAPDRPPVALSRDA